MSEPSGRIRAPSRRSRRAARAEVPDADVELDRFEIGVTRRRRARGLVDDERVHEPATELDEREALDLRTVACLVPAERELHDGVVRQAPVDRERSDASPGDHRERKEAGTDDLAQRLEATDPLADAFEPSVRADSFERYDQGLDISGCLFDSLTDGKGPTSPLRSRVPVAYDSSPRKAKSTVSVAAAPLRGPSPTAAEHERFRKNLVSWYGQNRRDLPFRRTRDPYAIWVSEVMLQQTQVATAISYYERWMERFPTVQALADAAEDEVLSAWQGLGYYSRAVACSRPRVRWWNVTQVKFPTSETSCERSRGSVTIRQERSSGIAFDRREPLVDGNVVRVLCRYFGLGGDPTRKPLKQALWKLAGELVPSLAPGDFNQALMELGAVVCTPRAPECANCPVAKGCAAKQRGQRPRAPGAPVAPSGDAGPSRRGAGRTLGKALVSAPPLARTSFRRALGPAARRARRR